MSQIVSIIGLIAVASFFIALVLTPFALFKGFARKDWKIGKITLIAYITSIVVVVISLILKVIFN